MRYGDIAKELCGIARELTDLAEKLKKIEAATPEIKRPEVKLPADTAQPEKMMLSVEEAGELLGVSRVVAYQLSHRDDFPVLHIGRRLLVPKGKLIEWVNNHCSWNEEF